MNQLFNTVKYPLFQAFWRVSRINEAASFSVSYDDRRSNRAERISDIEAKGGAKQPSVCGQRTSFNAEREIRALSLTSCGSLITVSFTNDADPSFSAPVHFDRRLS